MNTERFTAAKGTLYVWRIITVRWNPEHDKGRESTEFVTADSIEAVWEYLSIDRSDESVEILTINREVPILAELAKTEPKEEAKPEADAEGWIPHKPGDPMPCDAEFLIYFRMRNMDEDADKAGELRWSNKNSGGDIIAWKPA